ncbi:hypothetical protein CH300_00255 [Rhodococcus sp. 15-1154-1]|nr:hypothetical protein [Rhodococcus sp. 15-1154-1]OZF09848.1 hypothetical protein CH300_00255 [Rhodococcus sp. 15-1154-1]
MSLDSEKIPRRAIHRTSVRIVEGSTKVEIFGYRGVRHVANSRTRPGAEIDIWYEVDLYEHDIVDNDPYAAAQTPGEFVCFTIEGTGHPFYHIGQHVGTVFTHDGQYVWHVHAIAGVAP